MNFLLKKITIYTVLMHKQVDEETFFDDLMETYWFKETIDLFFNGAYRQKYEEIIADFLHRNILRRRHGKLYTTIKA
ncbi:MAG: hypothetical protein R6U38_09085 [Desulfatiglandaceae bacterium]